MQELGQLLLILTFLTTVATLATALLGAVANRHAWMRGARHGLLAVGLLTVAMSIILTHGFLTHDYSSRYIYEYSERAMPLVYKLAAFWGGERGALLFWVTSLAIFSNLAIYFRKDRTPNYLAWVTVILSTAILFFLVLMVFQTSPFDTWMAQSTPEDGRGLNPLLQNPVMAFHPPALLVGFILFTIPFAFGMAALITNKLDDQWISDTRRWTLISWTFLTVGLVLGCRWAYMEIGWGFWWMWDAVENAGLIPWFTSTAFIHSVMIQERRGMLKRWNVVLLALTFLLTIVGTWMTRSQIIVSIHAFANSELSDYFLVYMGIIAAFSTAIIGMRWKALRSEAHIESFMSREAMFVLNNIILIFCAVITLYGTLMGKITESETVRALFNLSEPVVWDEDKFNEVFVFIGIGLLVILGIGPLISWRKATVKNFQKNFQWPLAWGSLFTLLIALIVMGYESSENARINAISFSEGFSVWAGGLDFGDWMSILVYWLCAFVIFSVIREFHIAALVRKRQGLGGYWANWIVILFKNPRRYGGYVVHVGVVLMFIAFTGKAFKHEEKDRLMALGDTHHLKRYAITLVDRDNRYSEADGCFISDASFIAMPPRSTPSPRSIDRLDTWLKERQVSTYHLETTIDRPQMAVRFNDPKERQALAFDFYVARHFNRDFRRLADGAGQTLRYTFTDTKLVEVFPDQAMDRLRQAREAFQASGLPLRPEITPGQIEFVLRFDSQEAVGQVLSRIEAAKAPEWVLNVVDDPETGALHIIDRYTGELLVPESRYYPSKSTFTTEVSISSADFLVDLYLSMQPDMGRAYVKVLAVIFPLVNLLWIGSLLLLLGSLICLTPRWLGRTIAAMVTGSTGDESERREASVSPATVGATARSIVKGSIVLLAVGTLIWSANTAYAQEKGLTGEPLPEPTGFVAPTGDPAEDLFLMLECACPLAPGATQQPHLADPTCACSAAEDERLVVADLMSRENVIDQRSGRAKYLVLPKLIALDPSWEPRIRDPKQQLRTILSSTRTTCQGEYLMTLEATRATCSHRMKWVRTFRFLIAAGVSNEDIFEYYLASNNATEAHGPWPAHVLRTSDEQAMSYGLPVALTGGVVSLIGFAIWRNTKRKQTLDTPNDTEREQRHQQSTLSTSDRERLMDELHDWDA